MDAVKMQTSVCLYERVSCLFLAMVQQWYTQNVLSVTGTADDPR